MTVQTNAVSAPLASLLRAKGQRSTTVVAAAAKPTPTVVEGTKEPEVPEVPATSQVTEKTPEDLGRGNFEQSFKELKAHHDKTVYELRNELKKRDEELFKLSSKPIELPKTKEEVEAFRKMHPDAYDIMRTVALETVSTTNVETRKQIEEANRLQRELRESEAKKELLKIHPDAFQIRDTVQFKEWFNDQPDDIKNILSNSNNVHAVAKQLTLYKYEMGIETKKKEEAKERLTASMGVPIASKGEITPEKKVWTKSEVDAVCSNYKLWNKHRDEIDLARREGRYDPTK